MMDKSEILVAFRTAKNKKRQIKVLADLNCVAPREIATIVDEAGELQAAGLSVDDFSARYTKVAGAKTKTKAAQPAAAKKRGRPKSEAYKAPEPPFTLPPPPPPLPLEPSAMSVNSFLVTLGNLLAPVLDAELSINGERVTDVWSFEVTSRGKQVFVDVRTREV